MDDDDKNVTAGFHHIEADGKVDTVERNMVLKLVKPLKNAKNNESADQIELTEPTVAQWLYAASKPGPEADLHLLAAVTGLPPSVLRQMAMSDYVKATGFLLGFARSSPPDGQA